MKKILALFIALLMVISLASCATPANNDESESEQKASETEKQSNDESKPADDNNKNEEGKAEFIPTTDDEILEYVLAALNATNDYKGDISINTTSETTSYQAQGTEIEERKSTEGYFASFDATNKLRYWEETSNDSNHGSSKSLNKTFVINNVLYGIEKATDSESTEARENYFLVHDSSKDKYTISEHTEYLENIIEMYSGIMLAENFEEIKSAFDSTLPTLLADIYSIEDATPSFTKTAKTEAKDGAYTITLGFNSSYNTPMEGMDAEMIVNMTTELSAKDGKIVDFTMSLDMTQKVSQGETIIQHYSQNGVHSMDIEYSFAKAKYDALTTNLPTDAEDIHTVGAPVEDYMDIKTTLYVNGVKSDSVWYGDVTEPQEAFDRIIAQSGINIDVATIKLYKDAEMTQEILRDTVTKADILALNEVYLDVTPTDCALVITKFSERNEYSKPYKIIMPLFSMLGSSGTTSAIQPARCESAGEFHLNNKHVTNEYAEIWINGVKLDPKTDTITIENGKIYVIEYVIIISENNIE